MGLRWEPRPPPPYQALCGKESSPDCTFHSSPPQRTDPRCPQMDPCPRLAQAYLPRLVGSKRIGWRRQSLQQHGASRWTKEGNHDRKGKDISTSRNTAVFILFFILAITCTFTIKALQVTPHLSHQAWTEILKQKLSGQMMLQSKHRGECSAPCLQATQYPHSCCHKIT